MAWIAAEFFEFDVIVEEAMMELFDTKVSKSSYYFIFAILGILFF